MHASAARRRCRRTLLQLHRRRHLLLPPLVCFLSLVAFFPSPSMRWLVDGCTRPGVVCHGIWPARSSPTASTTPAAATAASASLRKARAIPLLVVVVGHPYPTGEEGLNRAPWFERLVDSIDYRVVSKGRVRTTMKLP